MRTLRMATPLVGLTLLAACADAPSPTGTAAAPAPDVALARSADDAGYIVVLRDDARDVPGLARQLTTAAGGELGIRLRARDPRLLAAPAGRRGRRPAPQPERGVRRGTTRR